jgi:hypothetical protein
MIGDRMPDGSVYAGISAETRNPIYAMSSDAPLTMTFNEAAEYAKTANGHKDYGYDDWRVPTKNELNVLFNNRASIGAFDISGPNPAGWYWSTSQLDEWTAWGQRFSDGYQGYNGKLNRSSLRLVRIETSTVT